MNSISSKILKSLRLRGRGFAFTAKDFAHLGARASLGVALARLAESGQIQIGRAHV